MFAFFSGQAQFKDRGTVSKEAANYVFLDHLCLSPQYGFASTEEEQWEKLRLIKDMAEEVWE